MNEDLTPVVIDKTGWPTRGPWDSEPDKVNWITEAGLDGMIHRGPGGHLCGYVAVPPGHPLHGKDYGDATCQPPCGEDYCEHRPESFVDVHGGLTYAAPCDGTICHVPEPGRPADVWWFGFDCAHLGDLSPAYDHAARLREETYKPVEYVRREVESLARQLAELGVPA